MAQPLIPTLDSDTGEGHQKLGMLPFAWSSVQAAEGVIQDPNACMVVQRMTQDPHVLGGSHIVVIYVCNR